MRSKRVETPDGLAGLKIRTPSRTGATVLATASTMGRVALPELP